MSDKIGFKEKVSGFVNRKSQVSDGLKISSTYRVKCFDKNGSLKWEDLIHNVVPTVSKNLILDTILAGSSYTVTGPYMGLISSVGYSAIAASDTMLSHAGWAEAGSGSNYPLYSGTRKTCAFDSAAAGSKALSSTLSFTIVTTGGTIKGIFIALGSGAVATIANTGGTLFSAALFATGDKVVSVTDVVTVDYSINLNA